MGTNIVSVSSLNAAKLTLVGVCYSFSITLRLKYYIKLSKHGNR